MELIADQLTVSRGGEIVFCDLGFRVAAGAALVVTGPNGAGKSTLLRTLCGLIEPAAGSARIEGVAGDEPPLLGEYCHYLGHENGMKPALTVASNLAFWRGFLGAPRDEIDQALGKIGLEHVAQLPFAHLSAGQRRRVALARLLVSYRPVWLVDEPISGLDERARATFAGLANHHLNSGGIIIAATHEPLGIADAATLEMRST